MCPGSGSMQLGAPRRDRASVAWPGALRRRVAAVDLTFHERIRPRRGRSIPNAANVRRMSNESWTSWQPVLHGRLPLLETGRARDLNCLDRKREAMQRGSSQDSENAGAVRRPPRHSPNCARLGRTAGGKLPMPKNRQIIPDSAAPSSRSCCAGG